MVSSTVTTIIDFIVIFYIYRKQKERKEKKRKEKKRKKKMMPRFNSFVRDVTSLPTIPHGTIWENQFKFVLQFNAKPCAVTQRDASIPSGLFYLFIILFWDISF